VADRSCASRTSTTLMIAVTSFAARLAAAGGLTVWVRQLGASTRCDNWVRQLGAATRRINSAHQQGLSVDHLMHWSQFMHAFQSFCSQRPNSRCVESSRSEVPRTMSPR
jgi:hypothetical protein